MELQGFIVQSKKKKLSADKITYQNMQKMFILLAKAAVVFISGIIIQQNPRNKNTLGNEGKCNTIYI